MLLGRPIRVYMYQGNIIDRQSLLPHTRQKYVHGTGVRGNNWTIQPLQLPSSPILRARAWQFLACIFSVMIFIRHKIEAL